MTRFVIDAYAWIEYFIGSEKGGKVAEIIEKDENEIFTNNVTLAEIVSKIQRSGKNYVKSFETVLAYSKVFTFDENFSKDVGLLHAKIREKIKDFGLADAFVLQTAISLSAKIVTGDEHFKGMKNVVLI